MKVLINAVSISEGGAKGVLLQLLASMRALRPDIEWIVATSPRLKLETAADPSVTWMPIPWINRSPLHVFAWYEFVLPALIKKHQVDVLFSQTNFVPRRKMSCPTLLLIQNAGHFSSEFDRLTQAALPSHFARFLWRQRTRWVCRSAKTATLVTVQTRALAEAISAATNRPVHEFVVIPHGCGLTAHADTTASDRRPDHFRIGYITKFGVQKNFKTLFKAAARLRDAGYPLKIVLTLDENFAPVREVMASAEEIGITDLIENHGEVNQAKISVLYDSLDLFVFPSFCESFGFPMVEAMARGLPIVVAATNENIETTYPASLTFPPLDAEELANRLAKLMDDDSERIKRGQLSLERGRDFSWDVAARQSIIALERALSRAEVKNGQMSPTGTKVTVI